MSLYQNRTVGLGGSVFLIISGVCVVSRVSRSASLHTPCLGTKTILTILKRSLASQSQPILSFA